MYKYTRVPPVGSSPSRLTEYLLLERVHHQHRTSLSLLSRNWDYSRAITMSFVDRVRAQLRPAARTQSMTLVDLAEPQRVPASAGMEHSTAPEKHEKGAIDIQNTLDHDDTDATEKQTMVEVRSGAVQIEAVQAVWGKYGKKLVIAG